MQTRLHNQTEFVMQATRELLDEVNLSANNLKATVHSTAAIISRLASFTSVTRWIPAAGAGMMVLFALSLIRPEYAIYSVTAVGQYSQNWFEYNG